MSGQLTLTAGFFPPSFVSAVLLTLYLHVKHFVLCSSSRQQTHNTTNRSIKSRLTVFTSLSLGGWWRGCLEVMHSGLLCVFWIVVSEWYKACEIVHLVHYRNQSNTQTDSCQKNPTFPQKNGQMKSLSFTHRRPHSFTVLCALAAQKQCLVRWQHVLNSVCSWACAVRALIQTHVLGAIQSINSLNIMGATVA